MGHVEVVSYVLTGVHTITFSCLVCRFPQIYIWQYFEKMSTFTQIWQALDKRFLFVVFPVVFEVFLLYKQFCNAENERHVFVACVIHHVLSLS